MTSRQLTRPQLNTILRQVERHRDYFQRLYERAQAQGMPLEDPLVIATCQAWVDLGKVEHLLAELLREAPGEPLRSVAHPLRNTTRNAAKPQRG